MTIPTEPVVRETPERMAATGSPVPTDGEQAKPGFVTYPLEGLDGPAPDGAVIPSALSLLHPADGVAGYPREAFPADLVDEAERDSTHSPDVDCAGLLPDPFRLRVGAVHLRLAGEPDPERVLRVVAEHTRPDQRVFVGVVDPVDPRVETPEEVCDRVLRAARHIPVERLGTCDDCGFSPFSDDTSTSRDTAFAEIGARVRGTGVAAERLGR
ncbi:uroporphyrinogen decarboxylase/cobalamine-independent methonine synthase family protein [Saccharothrix syringae]|uniref:Cobalamin-independent methionine synthase MetE C-terminal/archaeal domain-containing protein n=1 Tax=Saccharothrix syringae TaxID=103733 RepID=A0A5Q0GXC6_SACSY|nr:hypothetical protein [Saccharothrix syringae]QFZ18325.1 hypothetical protein EKG83_13270 [Saccharothrix syringae]